MIWQDLDRDRSIEARIARTVYFAHAASAERREDLVRTEADAGFQGHVLGQVDYRSGSGSMVASYAQES